MDEMRSHLSQMIRLSQTAGARVLLVGMALPPNYGQAYGRAFQMVYSDLAKQRKLPFVPLLVEGFATDRTRFQADGIHPNASAQGQMRDSVLKVLRGMVKN